MCEDLGVPRVKEFIELSLYTRGDRGEPRGQSGHKKREFVRHGGSGILSLILRNQLRMEPACGKIPNNSKRVSVERVIAIHVQGLPYLARSSIILSCFEACFAVILTEKFPISM